MMVNFFEWAVVGVILVLFFMLGYVAGSEVGFEGALARMAECHAEARSFGWCLNAAGGG